MGAIASQITSFTNVFSTVYSDADERKHQSSASLAFVRGIHRGPVNSPHKWPVTRKMFPFDDVIMKISTPNRTLGCLTVRRFVRYLNNPAFLFMHVYKYKLFEVEPELEPCRWSSFLSVSVPYLIKSWYHHGRDIMLWKVLPFHIHSTYKEHSRSRFYWNHKHIFL